MSNFSFANDAEVMGAWWNRTRRSTQARRTVKPRSTQARQRTAIATEVRKPKQFSTTAELNFLNILMPRVNKLVRSINIQKRTLLRTKNKATYSRAHKKFERAYNELKRILVLG